MPPVVLSRAGFALLVNVAMCALPSLAGAYPSGRADVNRGAYLARAGDCVACHTAGPQAPPFAGGRPLNSPFGKIYSSNITPDLINGIGRYTLYDFSRAVRNGIDKEGSPLYPAMPYPSFAKISDEDIRDLYAYFMTEVKPADYKPAETKLPFPFNIRWNLIFWDALFVKHEPYKPRNDHDSRWNRGAYLVQSLGHCGTCHTPRGFAFQEQAYTESSPLYLSGNALDNWFAPNLTGNTASGLGRWSEDDIASFLATGHGGQTTAFGSMGEVIENSTQYLHKDDLGAIAYYLKSLPAHGETAAYKPDLPEVAKASLALITAEFERPGAGLYHNFCAKCHKETGDGEEGKFPKLAGNSSVLAEDATSLIRLLLEGSKTVQTTKEPKPEEMPAFSGKFSDRQIADVLSFIRNSWGNGAKRVTPREVALLRHKLRP